MSASTLPNSLTCETRPPPARLLVVFRWVMIGCWIWGVIQAVFYGQYLWGILPSIYLFIAWKTRRLDADKITMTLEGDALYVGAPKAFTIPVGRLANVRIERVRIGSAAIGRSTSAATLSEQPTVDRTTAFVVFVVGKKEVPLTEEPMSEEIALQAMGAIRTFLRSHAWLPKDERNESDAV